MLEIAVNRSFTQEMKWSVIGYHFKKESGWVSFAAGGADETSDSKPGAFLKTFAAPHSLQKTTSGMLKVNPRVTCNYINQTERRT